MLVSRFDPLQEAPYRGSVLSTTASQIRIAFEDKFDLDDGLWRVDVGLSNIVFDRMRGAIARLSQDPRAQEDDRAPERQYILQGTHLRDVLLHSFSPHSASLHEPLQAPDDVAYVPRETLEHRSREGRAHGGAFEDDMRIHSWAQRYARAHPIEMDGDPALEGLNPTQIRAIAMMVGERISLVQGVSSWGSLTTRHLTRFSSALAPWNGQDENDHRGDQAPQGFLFNFALLLPGTGNEAVHFQVDFEVHHPILVCTYTNVAVDNLVEGFVAAGVTPLRVGFGAKVKASLGEYTLDYRLEQHPLKPKVDKLVEEKKSLEKRRAQLEKKVAGVQKDGKTGALERLEWMRTALVLAEKQAMSIKSKLYAMHQEMLRDIASAVDVVGFSLLVRLVARNVTDLHDLHYLGECGPERTRLPGGVSGRGIDVNRACVADTVDERGKSVSYLSVLV